ncbi:hypothetical protein EY653_05490 [Enterococcus faecalis]|uniref:CD3337/EF1877 family mobilome membrane protein n=1 Tax=Enterococcus faecalis TaxID=1351 RepID=UPI001AD63B8C|nr:hypothetical protein [Enterococcus faecalis]MBO6438762.1 hypothetical protein [Enterococcus faecalis]MBO6453349.1 hypothetical protein [Enterococcus faecalis]
MILREFFDDKSIQSLFSFDGSFWAFGLDEKGMGMLHSVLTIPFSLAKMIANMIDTGIEKLYTLNLLNESVDSILSTAQSIWNQFFNMFGLFFFAMVIMYVVKDYYFKSGGRAFVRLFIFFTILGFGNGFFANGSQTLKDFNSISGQLQADLTAVVSPDISELNNSLYKELGGKGKQTSTDSIRNSFYTMTVLKPWALMNFGKTDIKVDQYKEFLVLKGEDKKAKQEKIEKAISESSEDNYYMSSNSFHEKFFIGLTTLVNVIVLGAVVLIISVLNPLLQLLALLLILIFPILLGISLFPDKEDVAKNGGFLLVGIFFIKGLLGLGFGLTFLLFDLVDRFFGGANLDSFLLSFVLKAGVLLIVWRKRNTIMNVAKGNKISMGDIASTREFSNEVDFFKHGRKNKRNQRQGIEEVPDELVQEGGTNREGYGQYEHIGAWDDMILRSTVDDLSTDRIYHEKSPTELSGLNRMDQEEMSTWNMASMDGSDNNESLIISQGGTPYSTIPSHLLPEEDEEVKNRLRANQHNSYASVVLDNEDEKELQKRLAQSDVYVYEQEEQSFDSVSHPQENSSAMNESFTQPPYLGKVDEEYFESLERELSNLRGESIDEGESIYV